MAFPLFARMNRGARRGTGIAVDKACRLSQQTIQWGNSQSNSSVSPQQKQAFAQKNI
jgi:hypothetical protein